MLTEEQAERLAFLEAMESRKTYRIVRSYQQASIRKRIICDGLTLAEAQAHCKDPETSSSTCTNPVGRARTRRIGHWFDGYEHSN